MRSRMENEGPPRAASQGRNWQAIFVAAIAITIGNLFVLTWLVQQGWLAGSAFPKPLGMRLPAYGAIILAFVIALLAAYQSLRGRSKSAALGCYFGFVLIFSIGSIPVLQEFLARGIFVFRGPYSVVWDVTWGVVQFVAALALCEVFTRLTRSQ